MCLGGCSAGRGTREHGRFGGKDSVAGGCSSMVATGLVAEAQWVKLRLCQAVETDPPPQGQLQPSRRSLVLGAGQVLLTRPLESDSGKPSPNPAGKRTCQVASAGRQPLPGKREVRQACSGTQTALGGIRQCQGACPLLDVPGWQQGLPVPPGAGHCGLAQGV